MLEIVDCKQFRLRNHHTKKRISWTAQQDEFDSPVLRSKLWKCKVLLFVDGVTINDKFWHSMSQQAKEDNDTDA